MVLSKLVPINMKCSEYHHIEKSCLNLQRRIFLNSLPPTFKLYLTMNFMVLLFRIMTKKQVPKARQLLKTLTASVRSSLFLSFIPLSYTSLVCLFRKILGHYNLITISFLPAILSNALGILIEKPARRTQLALFVANVATETVWNMAVSRNLVKNVQYGDAVIFSASLSVLLFFYKTGLHQKSTNYNDYIFNLIKFVIGPYEANHCENRNKKENVFNNFSKNAEKSTKISYLNQVFQIFNTILLKFSHKSPACLHPFGCFYNILHSSAKIFSLALGTQVTLKLLPNIQKILHSPQTISQILFRKNNILNFAISLAGFTGLCKAILCVLRRITGKDSSFYAFPAGFISGIIFLQNFDSTLVLYVLWKVIHLTFKVAIDKDYVPEVPGSAEILFSFSTAILFHAAIVEPATLRKSYWKFVQTSSSGLVATYNRIPLDVWGLNSSDSLEIILKATNTKKLYNL